MKHRHVIAMVAGFALDTALGDPHGWPHPVRLIGKQIEFEEGLVRKYLLPEAEKAGKSWPLTKDQTEQLAGAALAGDVVFLVPGATYLLIKTLEKMKKK